MSLLSEYVPEDHRIALILEVFELEDSRAFFDLGIGVAAGLADPRKVALHIGGEIGEGSIAVGYHWRVFSAAVKRYVHITPLLGYSRHLQYLTISDGRHTIPPTGPIDNLDSNYNAEWSGPWLGLNLRLEADARNSVSINAEYHRADYYAEANWNLREDLAHPVSFKHWTQGDGFIVSMAFRRAVAEHRDLVAHMEAQKWRGNAGVDKLYTIDTTTKVLQPTATRLNEVNWQSLSAGVAATYHF